MGYLDNTGLTHLWGKLKEKFQKKQMFAITEDMVTVTTDDTKGVAPYSSSYGYTNIQIDDTNVEWIDGGIYLFVINTKLVVAGTYRNVRIRIGDDGDWIPMYGDSSILAGSSYMIKGAQRLFVFKKTYQTNGALHLCTDSNTTYAYLVNTVTTGTVKIDDAGYGARYSLIFPTTAPGVEDQRWSSIVKSSSTGTTKVAANVDKLYIDRHPQYVYSANIAAGAVSANATYQDYTAMDLRYTCNVSNTYLTALKPAYLYLHQFDTSDYSFKPDVTVGNIFSLDKLSTRFPDTLSGDVYLYFLGYTTATWYTLNPAFTANNRIYKYTPSTGEMTVFTGASGGDSSYITLTIPEQTVGHVGWNTDVYKASIDTNGASFTTYTMDKVKFLKPVRFVMKQWEDGDEIIFNADVDFLKADGSSIRYGDGFVASIRWVYGKTYMEVYDAHEMVNTDGSIVIYKPQLIRIPLSQLEYTIE